MEAIAAMMGILRIIVFLVCAFFILYTVVALGRIWYYSKKQAKSLMEIEKTIIPYIQLRKMKHD